MKASCIAKYLIAKSDNVGDLLTNKKLQKLLYYVKAWGVVFFRDGVIDEPFEAWIHGPVCRSVYFEYKCFGYNPIHMDYDGMSSSEFIDKFKKDNIKNDSDKSKIEMIDAVFNKYGKFSSFELELLSHSETPWIEARKGLSPVETGSNKIEESMMKSFYSNKN
ncbi:MAG TPA: DUF4065 domain-containing protein [Butyricimonas virosa]|uniref:DUF4065 domain-containing protein n=1 Tax=Butyricimonas virosa TaxID=544645 RepID=A0A921H654_9BACT|nr:DUF4065 domain-containing protein [Butyricimonas virosa]